MTRAAVYLGLGSNLGDRQSNILAALQKLRARCAIDAVSSFFESAPALGVSGPAFLNVAAAVRTDLEPLAFEEMLRSIEVAVGRHRAQHLAARPIDIDILIFGDVVRDFGRFRIPHPELAERAFNLIPLAEISPGVREPRSGSTVRELAERVAAHDVTKKERALHFSANRQEEQPDVKLSIDRVGVSRVKRTVRLAIGGRERLVNGEFTMVADLPRDRAGVHMSRFSEVLEEATCEVLARTDEVGRIQDVVAHIARAIVASQKALRAEVRLRADFGLERWTPVSGRRSEETYALVGIAHADRSGVRCAIGVEAEGMTACPCAQGMVREHSLRQLMEAGFSNSDAERALCALPVATHNQRGLGSVLVGLGEECDLEILAEDLVEIVENAMSSETYGLLKRPDEFFVVNKAHHNPKFVEDVVRGILSGALGQYADVPDRAFLKAAQINYESIHKHDAFAEAFGTFGELRRELRTGTHDAGKTDLAAWLETRPSAAVA